ncbi:MAG: hypothetical protein ACI81R_000713 [Bradymonadia bacterium]|jgi:hypothetical protein
MRSRSFAIFLAASTLCLVAEVRASTLPVISDATADAAEPSAWWVAAGAPPGRCLEAIVAASNTWIDPTAAIPVAQVSQLLRRSDITQTNAVSLGGLYNADAVATGTLSRVGDHDVAWTGARRAAVDVTILTINLRSGVSEAWTGRRVAFAATDEEALNLACRQLGEAISSAPTSSTTSVALPQDGLVEVHSRSGTAFPFVALVTALREIHPAVIDVREVWAAEGTISLGLTLDEGASWAEVSARIIALDGRALEGVRVLSAGADGGRTMIRIDAPPSER